MSLIRVLLCSAVLLFGLLMANALAKNMADDWTWQLPKTFPKPFVPADNPMTHAKVELGRHLFYDKRLSMNGEMSCGSCHIQSLAFSDGKTHSVGVTGDKHPKNTPALSNLVYSPNFNWANPAVLSLETQLLSPLFGEHPVELGLNDANFAKIQQQFAQDDKYRVLFTQAFGRSFVNPDDFRLDDIAKAIASFERSIISANSKYDQYLAGRATLSDSEKRGMDLFFGEKAECFHCHGSVNFNDQLMYFDGKKMQISGKEFHNTGLYDLGGGDYPDANQGLFEFTHNLSDKGKFKAPSLRNVAITAPYNHDGSTDTLEAVLQNYANGGRIIQDGRYAGDGRKNPNKSDLIAKIELTKQEQADIIAFLKTLTDDELLTNPAYADPFVK